MTSNDDLREQLAAYLDGELDEAAVIALEQRMAAEPWIAREADAMADLLVELGSFDDVPLPAGASVRLRAGLEAEIGHELPSAPSGDLEQAVRASGAAAATGWAAGRPGGSVRPAGSRPPAGARERALARRARMTRFAGVAAIVAVLSLGSVALLQGGFISGSDDTADSSADTAADDSGDDSGDNGAFAAAEPESLADSAAGAEGAGDAAEAGAMIEEEALDEAPADDAETATSDADETLSSDAAAADGAAAPAPASGPEAVDLGPSSTDEQQLRRAVADRPAAQSLLGRDAAQQPGLAAEYTAVLREQTPFSDGLAPAACLDTVLAAAGDVVPAVVAALDTDQGRQLAHALVRSADGVELDVIEVWVTASDGCGVTQVVG